MYSVKLWDDISWESALKGPLRDRAIAALHKEFKSLTDTILEEILPGDPLRAEAETLAITGRFLLDIKRDESVKARGVKHKSNMDSKKTRPLQMALDSTTQPMLPSLRP